MDRRKFLIGMGSLAAGGAAAMGTGAFTTMSAERNASINVVNDASGLIALTDETPSDVIRQEDGELVVDFTANGNAGGVNVNSRYQVGGINTNPIYAPWGLGWSGYPWSPIEDHAPADGGDPGFSQDRAAFVITNQSQKERDITLSFEADLDDTQGAFLYFQASVHGESGESGTGHLGIMKDITEDSLTLTVSPGNWIGVSLGTSTLEVDTNVENVDLSGTLTVSAE